MTSYHCTCCYYLAALLACAAVASADDSFDDSVDLTPWSNVGSGPVNVETSLRYAAQVTAEEAPQALPVQGEVTLAYTQQEIASGPLGTPRVVRRVDRITGACLSHEQPRKGR
jgi:hypothetical protein